MLDRTRRQGRLGSVQTALLIATVDCVTPQLYSPPCHPIGILRLNPRRIVRQTRNRALRTGPTMASSTRLPSALRVSVTAVVVTNTGRCQFHDQRAWLEHQQLTEDRIMSRTGSHRRRLRHLGTNALPLILHFVLLCSCLVPHAASCLCSISPVLSRPAPPCSILFCPAAGDTTDTSCPALSYLDPGILRRLVWSTRPLACDGMTSTPLITAPHI